MRISSATSLIFYSFLACAHASNEIDLAPLQLQLFTEAQHPENVREILFQSLEIVSNHLFDRFRDHYNQTSGDEFFVEIDLDVIGFEVNDDETFVDITMAGTALFACAPIPEEQDVTRTMADSFKGQNRVLFIERLLLESTNPFLNAISYLVIGVNGKPIANEDLRGEEKVADDTAHEEEKGVFISQKAILSGVVASVLAFLLLATVLCYISRRDEGDEPEIVRKSSTGSTDESETSPEKEPSSRSPSPVRSLVSQASSRFTYNPSLGGGFSSSALSVSSETTDSVTIPSNFSTLQVEVDQPIDIAAWKGSSVISPVTPTPFGQDISSIQKSSTSSMEEGEARDTCGEMTDKKLSAYYLSKEALNRLEDPQVQDKDSRQAWKACGGKSTKTSDVAICREDDSSSSFFSDASDVIKDLKKLSQQIEKHRSTLTR